MLPRLHMRAVDVRDVAEAHVRALERPASDGQRVIVTAAAWWFQDMADVLKKEFESQGSCFPIGGPGYSFSAHQAPYALMWLVSLFDSRIKGALPVLGKELHLDNGKVRFLTVTILLLVQDPARYPLS